jgi:starvation-inducible DNA-binding protein
MRPTLNQLSESTRGEAARLLNQRLADCLDLQSQCKQAHWNVRGTAFIALHELFDRVANDMADCADLIAERVVQLGGIAEGTASVIAVRSTLAPYPLALATSEEHVHELSTAIAAFARTTRIGIEEMDDLKDSVSADILTDVTRRTDKWLWYVEAHS